MNLKQIMSLLIICITGASIAIITPGEWHYIIGFTSGSMANLALNILEDRKEEK